MKWIFYNSLPICFLLLAGFLAYFDKDGWGWCIFGALLTAVMPANKENNGD